MKNYKLHVSEGFKDTYGDEARIKKEIENRVLNLYETNGYELIKTPALEYIDVYSLDGTQKPDLYNLINRQGEVLSLCNDMTASIARYVCTNNSLTEGAKKYCYVADTFRYPRLYQGKNHQFLQAGVEFIGEEGIESDVEVIYLAYQSLKSCNITDFSIHLGSREFLSGIFHDFNLEKEVRDEIYSLIDEKDYVTLRTVLSEKLDEKKADFLINLMLKGGKMRYMDSLMESLKDMECIKTLEYLKKVYMALTDLGVDHILFDFSIYSYAEYYTGIIFAIYVGGIGKAVLSGGRCDKLFARYGKDLADIGFGMDIDVLATYCLEHKLIEKSVRKYLSYAEDGDYVRAIRENDVLRSEGYMVSEMKFETEEEAMAYAKANGFDTLLVYKNGTSFLTEVK